MSPSVSKACRRCREVKPLQDFMKDGRRNDGRGSYCKSCGAKNSRKSRAKHPETSRNYYIANRDRIREQQQEYHQRPDVRESRRESKRAFARENAEVMRAARARWREKNPGYQAEWEGKNRDAVRRHKRKSENKRRARLKNVPCEDVDPQLIFERDMGICGICRSPVDPSDWHLDHIVPLALGGPHLSGNLQVSHPRCNMSKGSRLAA